MTTRPVLEKKIQADIEAAIGAEPDLLLLRNTVGMAKHYNDAGEMRMQRFGLLPGSPDLVGILKCSGSRPLGVWFALEIKCPGEDAEPHQSKCHDVWRKFGAIVFVVHSVDEARSALRRARAICSNLGGKQ